MDAYHPFRITTERRGFWISAVAVGMLVFATTPAFSETPRTSQPVGRRAVAATLEERGSWSSNPLLTTGDHKPLWGSITSAKAVFKDAAPLSRIDFGVGVDQNVFNQERFNSTDLSQHAVVARRSKSWSMRLQDKVDYDTSRTSELTTYGLSPTVVRHTGLSAAPTIGYNSSAVDKFLLSGAYSRSTYDRDILTDYQTYSVTPSYERSFDPRNTGIFSIQSQRYQTIKNNATEVDSINPAIGWRTALSPRLLIEASAGSQAARQFFFGKPVGPWSWEYTFAGGLSFVGEQDNLQLNAVRAQFPYGNGTEALQTSFAVSEIYEVNHRVTLDFRAKYLTSNYQRETAGSLETLFDTGIGLAYHLTETVDVSARYRYRYETVTNRDKAPQDHAGTMGLVYRPNLGTFLQ